MLDSHRLAPHPELTLDSLGRWWGRRGDRQGWKHTGRDRTGRDWLTLAQKQHGRPRERVEGQEAASLLLTLPVPLAGPRHPSGHFPTSSEGRKGEGQP